MATLTIQTRPAQRLRWFEPRCIAAVWTRELALYRQYWASTTFASIVEPTLYLLAFGFGFGSLVAVVAGYRYIEFVGTGVVATAVLFSSAFAGMFVTFVRRTFQQTYAAVLATPVDTHEIVTAEATWHAAKAGVYCCAPLVVAMLFGLDPSWGMLVVPRIHTLHHVNSGGLPPLFLVAGPFFPVGELPGWGAVLAQLNPLYHCVELVRHAVFGLQALADLYHVAVLVAFAGLMWLLATHYMTKRLID